jgi:hypothetical protein
VHGVVAVVQQLVDESSTQVIHGADFYWWAQNMWWGGDLTGFLDQCAHFGATWVKLGRMVRAQQYRDALGAAITLKDEWDA